LSGRPEEEKRGVAAGAARKPRVLGVIPARLDSTRLARKPLAPLAGKPLVQWVYEAARRARALDALVVATDSVEIAETVRGFGGTAMLTQAHHPSGTDRVAEVAWAVRDAEVIVNVQGDLPLLPPEHLDALVAPFLADAPPPMATLVAPLADAAALADPGVAKVVADRRGNALYFSRAPIPFARNGSAVRWQQIGIYGFTRESLFEFVGFPPSPLERTEGLEQLRAIENGITIRLVTVPRATPHVDTPEDLARVEALLRGG
jgi:3-deoxy-manno-octulosonate cytidylyltransferase (CMP-KDO synthetase)